MTQTSGSRSSGVQRSSQASTSAWPAGAGPPAPARGAGRPCRARVATADFPAPGSPTTASSRPAATPPPRARPRPATRGDARVGVRAGHRGQDVEHLAARQRQAPAAPGAHAHERAGVAGRRLGQRQQQVRGRVGPGGQVDAADQVTRPRVEHRDRGAGVAAQRGHVVLVGADQRRHPVGQGQPQAVGARRPLAEVEAGRQVHPVQRAVHMPVHRPPGQHQPLASVIISPTGSLTRVPSSRRAPRRRTRRTASRWPARR